GEGAAGGVGAAQSRRQADHQQPSVEGTEGRNRGIVPIRMAKPVFLPKINQSRAAGAVPAGIEAHEPMRSEGGRSSRWAGGKRAMAGSSSSNSTKVSACRRSSSATMGG